MCPFPLREIMDSIETDDMSNEIWIGLTDSSTGDWAWLDGDVGHFHWGSDQPDGGDEHCARIVNSQNWLSFDFNCYNKFKVLCEFVYRC